MGRGGRLGASGFPPPGPAPPRPRCLLDSKCGCWTRNSPPPPNQFVLRPHMHPLLGKPRFDLEVKVQFFE